MLDILVLLPVFNDQAALDQLINELELAVRDMADHRFSLLVVDDGSAPAIVPQSTWPVTQVQLQRNLGHQKAIALGLAYACKHLSFEAVVIMDADGEDRPEDVPVLLDRVATTRRTVVARRGKRQEGAGFKLSYRFYRAAFFLLTGHRIPFGNFMALPQPHAERLIYYSELWNHLPGALLKARLAHTLYSAPRGKRFNGQSQMSYINLVLHALGALGVFIEVIAVRLLLFSIGLIGITLLSILAIVGIKMFTQLAIPGWTSTVVTILLVVLLQSLLLSLFTGFLFLSAQTQRKFIPAHNFPDYIRSVKQIQHV